MRAFLKQKVIQALQGLGYNGEESSVDELGDFTTPSSVVLLSLLGFGVGILSAIIAWILLHLIGFFTNILFFQRFSFDFVSPSNPHVFIQPTGNHLGLLVILVPIIGGILIGLMARYGSERIRGHGIPEAIESILISGSRIEPKVALWKPISSALSIGSGGPFGAEGPIIMTGGAFGSIIAQFLRLTSAERKTLLVAGAAGGMSATFDSPVAAVLLAVELLLFEWKPRSMIPVAIASATAAVVRLYILGPGPLFPTPPHPAYIGAIGLLGCVLVGILGGALSAILTTMVYAAEDGFRLLPIHWMWWPALGGLVVGIGGYIFPQALGVGYNTIGAMLRGSVAGEVILGVLVVKSIIWAVSLGSGTSGGILAPLLMMGGALGGLEAMMLPNEGPGFWPLISMSAALGGTMRSPFTGVIFALELTHDVNTLLPLLVSGVVAHGFTVLVLKRSILTEKIARRGYHLTREYSIDPLEIIFVREVMRTIFVTLQADTSAERLAQSLNSDHGWTGQRLYPVTDATSDLLGVVTRNDLTKLIAEHSNGNNGNSHLQLADITKQHPVLAYPDEPLRGVVHRMATSGLTCFPVVDRDQPNRPVGIVSLDDLLKARARTLDGERRRERILHMSRIFPLGFVRSASSNGSNGTSVESVTPNADSTLH